MTDVKIINRDFEKLNGKLGWARAIKYFRQADRLLNPVQNNVVEYRQTGAVTLDKGVYTFHAFADLDLKEWRVAFTRDVTKQFSNQI